MFRGQLSVLFICFDAKSPSPCRFPPQNGFCVNGFAIGELVQRLLRCTGVNGNGPGFRDTVFSQHQDEAFRENTMTAKEKPKIPLPCGGPGVP